MESPPRGWQRAHSATFGCDYFFDPATGKSEWPADQRRPGGSEQPRAAKRHRHQPADLTERANALITADDRVGFPDDAPTVEPNPHGWFFPPHKVVMHATMNPETRCVLELGSWLGKSTRFIVERAPNAYIFAVDLWSNEHIRADPHYTQADGASEFMSHHQARARQIEENIKIIDTADIGEVFMKNMWEHRATASKPGVVPLKMSTVEGIELLAKAGIVPEAIYVDASHHYKDVIQELTLCLKYFPDASVCGDDWDYPPVARAAKEVADRYHLRIHAEGGKCWTFERIHRDDLRRARDVYYEADVSKAAAARYKKVEAALKAGDIEGEALLELVRGEEEGVDVEKAVNDLYPPKGRTMLMLAAIHGRHMAAAALVSSKAFVDMQTKQKRETALHLAAYHGHEEVVKVLLQAEANTTMVNEYQETAQQAAHGAGKEGAAKLIAAAAAKKMLVSS